MTPAASGYDYNPSWSATHQRRRQQHAASGSNRLAPVVRAATGVGGAHGQPTRMSQPQPLPPPRESSNDSTATTSGEKKKRVGEQAFDPAPSASAMLRQLSLEMRQQTRQAEEEVDLHERSSDKLRRELEVREMIMSALCSAL